MLQRSGQAWRSDRSEVLLVSMPWTTLTEPSLGLALLKAVLAREGIDARVMHLNLFLLEHLKASTYEALSVVYVLNDFLFTHPLEPEPSARQLRWLRRKVEDVLADGILDARAFDGADGLVGTLLRLRNDIIPAWLARWADEIAASAASMVGFTCMFDQTIASLALARLVRARAPDKLLVLGGYAVRAPTAQMLIASCPWIDAICDGEGEAAIVGLARAAAGRAAIGEVPGVVYRDRSGMAQSNPPGPAVDLDANPTPDFGDYFTDLERLSIDYAIDVTPPDLPIENSRGCWWGAKSHCTFCGIRDDDLVYRHRRADRVLADLHALRERHGINTYRFADYILPHRYYDTLLPALADLDRPFRLSGEIKANVSEDRVARLKRAGFREVQPGIESFSSSVLRKMRKGVSSVQNVYTLLLGRRFGIRVHYNILYGFPDDDPADYARMAALLPRLVHLDAPNSCVPVQITRYAPLHSRPEAFGLAPPSPEPCYELLFSRDYLDATGFGIEDFCYYFERSFENGPALSRSYAAIRRTVGAWREFPGKQVAGLHVAGVDDDGLRIVDGRGGSEVVHRLDAALAELLAACERPISMSKLAEAGLERAAPADIPALLGQLDRLGLVFIDEDLVVSLVLPASPAPAYGAFIDTIVEERALATPTP